MDTDHFNQTQKRDAEFINPPNILKAKIGSGGIDEKTLDRAQKVLESNTVDFVPIAERYLNAMMVGIENARSTLKSDVDPENTIAGILYPCVQLKANGATFHFPLVTRIAGRFVNFMEVVEHVDHDILEIATGFHGTIKLIIKGKIKSDSGPQSEQFVTELNNVCTRYFEKQKTGS